MAEPVRLEPGDVELALEMIKVTAEILSSQGPALAALVDRAASFEAAGFISDPTLYRQTLSSKTYAANIAMARASLAFLAAAEDWRAAHGIIGTGAPIRAVAGSGAVG